MVLRHVLVVGCIGAAVAIGCGGGTATTISDVDGGDGGGDGAASSAEGGGGNGNGNGFTDGGGGPGGNTTSVPCGGSSCSLATETCCVVDRNGVVTYQCATGTCGSLDAGGGDVVSLKCTAQANCATGTICCIDQPGGGGGDGGGGGGGGGGAIASSCVAGTVCPNGAQLCDPSAASSGCPAGKNSMCSSDNIGDWGLAPPFATCGGVAN